MYNHKIIKAGDSGVFPKFLFYQKKIQVRCSIHLPCLSFNLKQFFNLSLFFMTLTFWVSYFIKYPSVVVCVLSFMIKFKDCIRRMISPEEMLCFAPCILIKAFMMLICPTTVDLNFNHSVKRMTARLFYCKIFFPHCNQWVSYGDILWYYYK